MKKFRKSLEKSASMDDMTQYIRSTKERTPHMDYIPGVPSLIQGDDGELIVVEADGRRRPLIEALEEAMRQHEEDGVSYSSEEVFASLQEEFGVSFEDDPVDGS